MAKGRFQEVVPTSRIGSVNQSMNQGKAGQNPTDTMCGVQGGMKQSGGERNKTQAKSVNAAMGQSGK